MRPFPAATPFRNFNTLYFAAAHRIVDEARRRGITVWLCPAYLGWGGGDEGFFSDISAAGPSALRDYGRFVGRTFRDLPNVVWLIGGDYAFPPSLRWLGDELAAGLRDGGARQLMSAHGGQTEAFATFGDRPWLDVNTVYSYSADLRPSLLAAYARTPVRPFVLIEAIYEGEHDSRPEQIRRQAWTAALSGAAGEFFGNNPIWHFNAPAFPMVTGWSDALNSIGARDMARLDAFLRARRWSDLVPDAEGTLIGPADGAPAVAAAWNPARDLAVAYIPAGWPSAVLPVNLSSFPHAMKVRWFDPGGKTTPRDGSVLHGAEDGQHLDVPRSDPSDRVLVLERQ